MNRLHKKLIIRRQRSQLQNLQFQVARSLQRNTLPLVPLGAQ